MFLSCYLFSVPWDGPCRAKIRAFPDSVLLKQSLEKQIAGRFGEGQEDHGL